MLIMLIGCDTGISSSPSLASGENQNRQDVNVNQPATTEQNKESVKSAPPEDSTIWDGQIGEFSVDWSRDDVSFIPNKSPKLKYKLSSIFKKRFDAGFLKVKKEISSPSELRWRQSTSLSIKSIVGSIVSVEMIHSYGLVNTAHALAYITFDLKTLDEAKLTDLFSGYLDSNENNLYSSASAKLSDYFTEDEIFKALISKLSEKNPKIELDRKTFLSMINGNSNKMPEISINIGKNENGIDLFLASDSFKSFAFDKIKEQKVVIRMQVYENTGKPYEFHWLELSLPIPSRLKPQLEKAENFQNGFLLSNSEVKFKGAETVLTFEKPVN